jgi:hypothetical protein
VYTNLDHFFDQLEDYFDSIISADVVFELMDLDKHSPSASGSGHEDKPAPRNSPPSRASSSKASPSFVPSSTNGDDDEEGGGNGREGFSIHPMADLLPSGLIKSGSVARMPANPRMPRSASTRTGGSAAAALIALPPAATANASFQRSASGMVPRVPKNPRSNNNNNNNNNASSDLMVPLNNNLVPSATFSTTRSSAAASGGGRSSSGNSRTTSREPSPLLAPKQGSSSSSSSNNGATGGVRRSSSSSNNNDEEDGSQPMTRLPIRTTDRLLTLQE